MANILVDRGKGRTEAGSDALFWGPHQGDDMAPEELGLRDPASDIGELRRLLRKKQGMGRMGGPLAAGPDGKCVCPSCGATVEHDTGKPCSDVACPECGTDMTRQA